ncbi:uncharacterized protein EV420DRAFT_1481298 [Desarmillaria tabescens]|uniref:Uncharacterized protein n=1 Tax=Armillaria tabescens TaxID=1929756 RepID=A0AA39K6K1_ARMTA|nr:uncharacterized protein EV420DRAFT_1481298 [Desarmillaria tabescens]KAK0455440.1 hypothetical protein EV420DRAFT_1481298 [Desarmillaria tabescens]
MPVKVTTAGSYSASLLLSTQFFRPPAMDRFRRIFKTSFSSAAKRKVSSPNVKSATKGNLKHTKSMPIRSSLEYPPNDYSTSHAPPKNSLKSAKIYTPRFTTRNKPAASQPVPRDVNADLQEEEDYGNVLDMHSGVTLDQFPMPPNTIPPPHLPNIQAFHERCARQGYKTIHGNASTPTVYHHGSTRQKLTSPSTTDVNTASHRGRSRHSKPLPFSPADWQNNLNSPSTTSLHSNNQTHSSRHRQGSTTPHRSRSRAAPSSRQRVQEHSQYMTEQGMASYPGVETVAAVRRGHGVFQYGESDHRKSHRVEVLFSPGDEPVPVRVSQIRREVDDYLVSQNLARDYGAPF